MKKKEKAENKEPASEELSWSAAEHEYVEKDTTWYLAIAGLTLLLLLIAIWQGKLFFCGLRTYCKYRTRKFRQAPSESV